MTNPLNLSRLEPLPQFEELALRVEHAHQAARRVLGRLPPAYQYLQTYPIWVVHERASHPALYSPDTMLAQ